MAVKDKSDILDWMRSKIPYNEPSCLVWPFSGNWNGYGHVKFDGRVQKAHRVMCILAHGEPPDHKFVAGHSCLNGQKGCVSPLHLSWKTYRQNLLDRRKDGTLTKKRWTRYGTLTDDQVRKICSLKGEKNQREIGAMFGISYQHVSVIQNGKLKRQKEWAASA